MRNPVSIPAAVILLIAFIAALSIVLLVFADVRPASAIGNWEQTSGPSAAGVNVLFRQGTFVFAGTGANGVYRSSDNGATWTAANAGLDGGSVLALAGEAPFLYASTQPDNAGHGNVFHSSNNGSTWTAAVSGLSATYIQSLLATGGYVLAGDVGSGVFKSTDHGQTWFASNSGMGLESVKTMTLSGSTLYAAGSNFTYRSTDQGANWIEIPELDFYSFFSMAATGTDIYAGGFDRVIRSTDSGNTWEAVDLSFPQLERIASLSVNGTTVYAGTGGAPASGVYKSTNRGATWAPANKDIEIVTIDALAISNGRVLAGSAKKGILVTDTGGASWSPSNAGLPPGGEIRKLFQTGGTVFAATGGDGIYRTNDHGTTWIKSDADSTGRLKNELIFSITAKGGVLFAGTSSSGVFRSIDGGSSWRQANTGLPVPVPSILDLAAFGATILAGTGGDGIYSSSDNGDHWTVTTVGSANVFGVAAAGGFGFAIVNTGLFPSTGIYRSTDGGHVWSMVFQSGNHDFITLAAESNHVYAGDLLSGMIRSGDSGSNWQDITPEPGVGVFSIFPTSSVLYAGGMSNGQQVYRSTNFGSNWVAFNEGLIAGEAGEALTGDPNYVYVGTDLHGVWRRFLGDPAGVDAVGLPAAQFLEQNDPNPFVDQTAIRFTMRQAGRAQLSMFDAGGRLVLTLMDGPLSAGGHVERVDGSGLAPGVYFYRLSTATGTETRKMVLRR